MDPPWGTYGCTAVEGNSVRFAGARLQVVE